MFLNIPDTISLRKSRIRSSCFHSQMQISKKDKIFQSIESVKVRLNQMLRSAVGLMGKHALVA